METADLEISIRKTQIDAYSVELRFNYEKESQATSSHEGILSADFQHLRAAEHDIPAYGRMLTEYFFKDANVRDAFLSSVNSTLSNGDRCRIRLFIGSSALELQKLRWELLEKPDTNTRISTSAGMLFSRYMFSNDFRSVHLRPQGEVRALIAVSTLTQEHASQFNLAPLDPHQEITRARLACGEVACDHIGADQPLTLTALWTALQKGDYDILYLLGHGSDQGRPIFFIEREDPGRLDTPYAEPQEFVNRFSGLLRVPRLVILGSCQSSFTTISLGPRLVEAGIPAVIAMQDSISIQTFQRFVTVLFSELTKDGAIDEAVAAARDVIRDHQDCWMPVLFSRLKDNRIWFKAGFTSDPNRIAFWTTIIDRAKRQKLVPIIGPGFGDYIHGDLQDLAKSIVDTYRLPRPLRSTDSFPHVCQSLLAVTGDRDTAINNIRNEIRCQIQRYHAGRLPQERFVDAEFQDLLWEVRQALPKRGREDAYGLLAGLDVPVFINTTRDDLLVRALAANGKEPKVVEWPWRGGKKIGRLTPPTAEKPIVYHVFGTFENDQSLVLTEDDFFEFLIRATNNRDQIPEEIRSRTSFGSLAFLGFQLTDWSLRVLLNMLMNQESREAFRQHVHVAVQLSRIDDGQNQTTHLATYLARLIREFGDVQIFWGRPDDFLTELLAGLTGGRQPPAVLPQAA